MMDQQLLKKHTIGYNTVSSVDGIINARGVKSKPNNIEIMGYTHEVGEGEKSPDNPYTLVSLDSGNVNLYSEDKITDIQVTNEGAIMKGIELDVSKFRSGYISIFHTNNIDISDNTWSQKGINIKFFRNGEYDKWTDWCLVLNSRTEKIPEDVSKILLYETNASNGGFDIYQDLTILDSPILPTEPVTDEHSIVLSNNDRTIQVPTPIALNCVEGVSDRIVKKEDGYYYIEQNIQAVSVDKISIRDQKNGYTKFNINIENGKVVTSNKIICDKLLVKPYSYIEDFSREYIRSSMKTYPDIIVAYMLTSRFTNNSKATVTEISAYLKDNPLEILYQVENPYYLRLSDYAQQLLNSFELQNNNEISVEGLPEIKISGYIQN